MFVFVWLSDLMQGVNPSEAFSSLPRSLQGMDELEDSSSLISADATSSQAWSLEREEVGLTSHKFMFNYHDA